MNHNTNHNHIVKEILKEMPRNISLREIEAWYTLIVLERNYGNKSMTGREIKVKLRTLRNKIYEYTSEKYPIPPMAKNGQPRAILETSVETPQQTNL